MMSGSLTRSSHSFNLGDVGIETEDQVKKRGGELEARRGVVVFASEQGIHQWHVDFGPNTIVVQFSPGHQHVTDFAHQQYEIIPDLEWTPGERLLSASVAWEPYPWMGEPDYCPYDPDSYEWALAIAFIESVLPPEKVWGDGGIFGERDWPTSLYELFKKAVAHLPPIIEK